MPDYRAYIANCLISGEIFSNYSNGSSIRDKIELNIDNYLVQIIQKPNIVNGPVGEYSGRFIHTTDILIKNINYNDIEKCKKITNNLCSLLSFAGLSKVRYFGYKYPDDTINEHFWRVHGVSNYFRPTIDIRQGHIVRNFIIRAYPNYVNLKYKRKLETVINYLTTAEMQYQPVEIQLVISFIILESLKSTFANVDGIPFRNGYYRKISHPGLDDRYSFQELLDKMLFRVGLRRGLKQIIKLRNDLIHSGFTKLSPRSQIRIYTRAVDIIREYLLKLLNYSGEYICYKDLKRKNM